MIPECKIRTFASCFFKYVERYVPIPLSGNLSTYDNKFYKSLRIYLPNEHFSF